LVVHHISDVMKVTFELSIAAIALGLLIAIGAAVRSAAHDNGLVIEAFNVPSDMAAKGLTGQVVATQVQDRLARMLADTDTIRTASSFRNDWGDNLKVQIPETGVSIGEFYRYLASWLGDQTRISGEVWRTPTGIAVSARAGSEPARKFTGAEAELDSLVDKTAEHIYARTQPYRYIVYLTEQNRNAEALVAARALALNGPPEEKPWGYSVWGLILIGQGDMREAHDKEMTAATLGPDLPPAFINLAGTEAAFGHDEARLADNRHLLETLDGPGSRKLAAYAIAAQTPFARAMIAEQSGDFLEAVAQASKSAVLPDYSGSHRISAVLVATDLAADHDVPASLRADPTSAKDDTALVRALTGESDVVPLRVMARAVAREDWAAVRDDASALRNMPLAANPSTVALMPVEATPWLAYAEARLGDPASARAIIGKTPLDCDLCVRMRGNIEAVARNWDAAAHWFALVSARAPSIPFADTDWGEMLLHKGDFDGAIAKFSKANAKGPHFADSLEMWGEALIAQNRSDLALAKFEEAAKYAPNWGRLHLKWAEALLYLGRRDAAKVQFAAAAGLDMNAAERATLARLAR
jgi:tetratricopeptide (TPR) repeat protein